MAGRILCLGNRYAAADDAGPRVHDRLAASPLPPGVAVLDGGLAGLGLLPWFERCGREGVARVVVVDAVEGFATPGSVVELDPGAVAAAADPAFGHGAGLPWLLRALPLACDGPLPEVRVVGIEAGGAADEALLERAAALSLRLAMGDAPWTT